jgi:hypothetical protein
VALTASLSRAEHRGLAQQALRGILQSIEPLLYDAEVQVLRALPALLGALGAAGGALADRAGGGVGATGGTGAAAAGDNALFDSGGGSFPLETDTGR